MPELVRRGELAGKPTFDEVHNLGFGVLLFAASFESRRLGVEEMSIDRWCETLDWGTLRGEYFTPLVVSRTSLHAQNAPGSFPELCSHAFPSKPRPGAVPAAGTGAVPGSAAAELVVAGSASANAYLLSKASASLSPR